MGWLKSKTSRPWERFGRRNGEKGESKDSVKDGKV